MCLCGTSERLFHFSGGSLLLSVRLPLSLKEKDRTVACLQVPVLVLVDNEWKSAVDLGYVSGFMKRRFCRPCTVFQE